MSTPVRVERIVRAALDCGVRRCDRPETGRVGETYLLELDEDPNRAVCKVGGESVRTGDVVEPLVIKLVGDRTEVPVPDVLATGQLRERTTERRWALYEYCSGTVPQPFTALQRGHRRAVLKQVGSILGRLHAVQFERTGGLARSDDSLQVVDANGLTIPQHGRRILNWSGANVDGQPVLAHGDLFPGNVLVADGNITTVLDWGNAHVTTAGYALARTEMRFIDWFRFSGDERQTLRIMFREGYRTQRQLPVDYPELARIYKAFWLLQLCDRIGRHLSTRRGRGQLRRHLLSLLPNAFHRVE